MNTKMKRILVRAGMSPLQNYLPNEAIIHNLIGNNIGNLLFQSGVCKALLCQDTVIDTMNTARPYSQEDIRQINEEYDCLVFPFANAFRRSFIDQLNAVTSLVKQVRCPCVVVGVGMQEPLEGRLSSTKLDTAVADFMKAILQKSSMVGVRGEYTAQYLTKLGFRAERDFTVIGCPSMYLYGKKLPELRIEDLTPYSRVSMNSKISLPQKFHDFMYRCSRELPDHQYVPQVVEELRQMYMGKKYPAGFAKRIPKHFPVDFTHPAYQSGVGISFVNLPSWLKYLKDKDFSVGSRIHGNIAAILAGTPCYIIASDKRIIELADYHEIPYLTIQELKKDTSIFDLYDKADFSRIRKGHRKRFMHYLDFLQTNNLSTIFDEKGNCPGTAPFDQLLKKIRFAPPVRAFSNLSPQEQLKRLRGIYREEEKRHSGTAYQAFLYRYQGEESSPIEGDGHAGGNLQP